MKRVGRRGEGKFERISWEETFDLIAEKMKIIKEKYGNEAFYINYCTGSIDAMMSRSWPSDASPVGRLMNCYGGYLDYYNTYSYAQMNTALSYTYGKGWAPGNSMSDIVNGKLVVFFGNNPAETRMSDSGAGLDSRVRGRDSLLGDFLRDHHFSSSMIRAISSR